MAETEPDWKGNSIYEELTYLFIKGLKVMSSLSFNRMDVEHPADYARAFRDSHWPGTSVAILLGGEHYEVR